MNNKRNNSEWNRKENQRFYEEEQKNEREALEKRKKQENQREKAVNEIFKQKYNQDLPFVAEKINKYACEKETKYTKSGNYNFSREEFKEYKKIEKYNRTFEPVAPKWKNEKSCVIS